MRSEAKQPVIFKRGTIYRHIATKGIIRMTADQTVTAEIRVQYEEIKERPEVKA